MDKVILKIEEMMGHPGLEPETITLLKMAVEAQRTGKMPPLPISMQPLPNDKDQAQPKDQNKPLNT